MARRSYAKKVDANQGEIVEALEKVGYSVCVTNMGDGFPDLVIARSSQDAKLVEVKNPRWIAYTLTADQKKFHSEWRGQIYIVTSVQDALDQLA